MPKTQVPNKSATPTLVKSTSVEMIGFDGIQVVEVEKELKIVSQ